MEEAQEERPSALWQVELQQELLEVPGHARTSVADVPARPLGHLVRRRPLVRVVVAAQLLAIHRRVAGLT